MTWAARTSKIQVGDQVAISARFLRSIGHDGVTPCRKGMTLIVAPPCGAENVNQPKTFWNAVCVKITKGLHVVIDIEDYERVAEHRWHAHIVGNNKYARKTARIDGRKLNVPMQRVILGIRDSRIVDHRNGDGLDNRKANLRIASKQNNNINIRPRRGCKSQYKGVLFESRRKAWVARIQHDGKSYHLGQYGTEQDAARAYNYAASLLFEDYARLNDIEPKILVTNLSRVTERGVLDHD